MGVELLKGTPVVCGFEMGDFVCALDYFNGLVFEV